MRVSLQHFNVKYVIASARAYRERGRSRLREQVAKHQQGRACRTLQSGPHRRASEMQYSVMV